MALPSDGEAGIEQTTGVGSRRPASRADGPSAADAATSGLVLARDADPALLTDGLRSGRLRRTRRGAYHPAERSVGPAIDHQRDALRRIAALAAQLSTPMWFSHESAALIWGFAVVNLSPQTHLTQLYPQNARTDRQVIRHCATLPEVDRTVHRSLPVTGIERTVLDCALALPVDRALVIADSALNRGADAAGLVDRLRRLAGHRGVRRARAVLALADGRAESPGETLVRFAIHHAGLPEPELQIGVATASGTFWLDLGWSRWKLAIEFDGFVKYAAPYSGTAADAVFAEKLRQDALEDVGWKIIRVTWADLRDPAALARRIRRHLTARTP